MMDNQFFCKNRDRWKKVIETPEINGIDYLEVSSYDQKTLMIYFLHDLVESPIVIPPLSEKNIIIEGGVRIKNINVLKATSLQNVLTVIVDQAGDFSNYILKIGNSLFDPDNSPPGFDQELSSIEFSFKINCPSDFDCKVDNTCPPGEPEEPAIDYLAKDYSSFNRLMLDRLSVLVPDWKERNAADLQVALIEILAYVGDHLSYYQDAVATEAYLGTARRRISAKRHARLLDYFVHDGCNARVWVQIQTEIDGLLIKKSTPLLTNYNDNQITIGSKEAEKLIKENGAIVFETMHDATLYSRHNQISFYTWCDCNCCLPKGSTKATLLNQSSNTTNILSPPEPFLQLNAGDILIFEEIRSPVTGAEADANPSNRCAVRLKTVIEDIDKLTNTRVLNIEWYQEDALLLPLCLTSTDANGNQHQISVVRANIVLADHGSTQNNNQLYPAFANGHKYYPKLVDKNITAACVFNEKSEKANAAFITIKQDPHYAIPAIQLINQYEIWEPKKDLLNSNKFATEFVMETENDGTSYLRFGDGFLGKKPDTGFSPEVIYRIGNGAAGNVGADTINTLVWEGTGIIKVRNPLAASGGKEAETMEQIRQFAPQAFRTQERAVIESDYVEKTKLHPQVQNAAARFYWTGSWYTVYIIIDRMGGDEVDEGFKQEIIQFLEQYRMAGYDLEVIAPTFVPLNILMNVCVKQGHFAADVKQNLLKVFSNSTLSDGTQGYFYPDNFTFGQPVYLSSIYETAMKIDGVSSVEIKTFQRWTKNSNNEIENGLLKPSLLEIIRLDNDPSLPENGKIDFIMLNGL